LGIEALDLSYLDSENGAGAAVDGLKPGWPAVSVNLVYRYPYPAVDGKGGKQFYAPEVFKAFGQLTPSKAGYSINIYEIDYP
jgi:hypothetical protein